jgi:hypothetical protein
MTAFFAFVLVLGAVLLAGSLLLVRGKPNVALAFASFFAPAFGMAGLTAIVLGAGSTASMTAGAIAGAVCGAAIVVVRRRD